MDFIKTLLAELTERLPELEWKITQLSPIISAHKIPKGLFRPHLELTGAHCIEEIKADIQALYFQKNERAAHFLAERIKQKVNVLVALCQIEGRKSKPEAPTSFSIKSLSTRQQWIQSMEQEIATLEAQQEAMLKSLAQMKQATAEALLQLKHELGEVGRRLTLSKEALGRAVEIRP